MLACPCLGDCRPEPGSLAGRSCARPVRPGVAPMRIAQGRMLICCCVAQHTFASQNTDQHYQDSAGAPLYGPRAAHGDSTRRSNRACCPGARSMHVERSVNQSMDPCTHQTLHRTLHVNSNMNGQQLRAHGRAWHGLVLPRPFVLERDGRSRHPTRLQTMATNKRYSCNTNRMQANRTSGPLWEGRPRTFTAGAAVRPR